MRIIMIYKPAIFHQFPSFSLIFHVRLPKGWINQKKEKNQKPLAVLHQLLHLLCCERPGLIIIHLPEEILKPGPMRDVSGGTAMHQKKDKGGLMGTGLVGIWFPSWSSMKHPDPYTSNRDTPRFEHSRTLGADNEFNYHHQRANQSPWHPHDIPVCWLL